jgi:hypothetical protein
VVTETGPTPAISHNSPAEVLPRRNAPRSTRRCTRALGLCGPSPRGLVTRLDEGIGEVGLRRLPGTCPACLGEELVGPVLHSCQWPRPGTWGQPGIEAEGAVGLGRGPQPPAGMDAP